VALTSLATTELLPLDASRYERHPLHVSERVWSETNCYVDVWIEVLHALGLDPLAAASFALVTDFETDQWTFFKYEPEDLRELYGIRVFEMNPWRPLLEHVVEHLAAGRLITLEADSWYLPDTAGVSYRIDRTKSTIVPNLVDPEARRLGYFHNASYFELEGEDFDGVFRLGDTAQVDALPPYVETVRLDGMHRLDDAELHARSVERLRRHLRDLPTTNPVERLHERLGTDLDAIRADGVDAFHLYAFATVRQLGASAELSSSYLGWLAEREAGSVDDLRRASDDLLGLAQAAKSVQFLLARLARGRSVDVDPSFAAMAAAWESATSTVVERYGR